MVGLSPVVVFIRSSEECLLGECSASTVSLDSSPFLPFLFSFFLCFFYSPSLIKIGVALSCSGFSFLADSFQQNDAAVDTAHTAATTLNPRLSTTRPQGWGGSVNERAVTRYPPTTGRNFAGATVSRESADRPLGIQDSPVNLDNRRGQHGDHVSRGWRIWTDRCGWWWGY